MQSRSARAPALVLPFHLTAPACPVYASLPPADALLLHRVEPNASERLALLVECCRDSGSKPAALVEKLTALVPGTHLELDKRTGTFDAHRYGEDAASHWVLRLALCRDPRARLAFVQFEAALLQMRLQALSPFESRGFLLSHPPFPLVLLAQADKTVVFDELCAVAARDWAFIETKLKAKTGEVKNGVGARVPEHVDATTYYLTKWTNVLGPVATRRVFIREGIAYVPEYIVTAAVAKKFRADLDAAMLQGANSYTAAAAPGRVKREVVPPTDRAWEWDDTDAWEREGEEEEEEGEGEGEVEETGLDVLVNEIRVKFAVSMDAAAAATEPRDGPGFPLTCDNVHKWAVLTFPLCMRQIHEHAGVTQKMKYQARLQYIPFLFGAGMSLSDCLEYLARRMRSPSFVKENGYNIRYLYGQNGARKRYTPKSCAQIIQSPPPASRDQCHGCPFKTYSERPLKHALLRDIEDLGVVADIVGLAKKGDFQGACRCHFASARRHAGVRLPPEIHPVAWYSSSRRAQIQV